MARENLNILTKISFFTALAMSVVLPAYIALKSLDDSVNFMIRVCGLLTLILSVFGMPLSIVSMFSKVHVGKRIFALLVNSLPISLIIYALTMEFIDEFFRTAP